MTDMISATKCFYINFNFLSWKTKLKKHKRGKKYEPGRTRSVINVINMKVDVDAVTVSAEGYTGRGWLLGCLVAVARRPVLHCFRDLCAGPLGCLLAGLQCWPDISDFYSDYPISHGY
jgi:hypothetical protein